MITINTPDLNEGGAMAELRALAATVARPIALMQVAGKALANEVRTWFQTRNGEGNKHGWPSRNFWNRLRNATALAEVHPDSATVSVADAAMNLKVYGGQVVPKRGKALAIPANAQAYKAGSPREGGTPPLRFGYGWDPDIEKWRPALLSVDASRVGSGLKKDAKQSSVWYWLCKSAWHQPDPDALPPTEQMQQAILASVRHYVQTTGLRGRAA